MTDLEQILPLWRDLKASGTEYVLATVVGVEGSGYRKPGAMMLIAADGRRAGTISGGCLEGEVAKKALWHTDSGPVVRSYSTLADDGDVPYGMGCGGVVHMLLERDQTASQILSAMEASFAERTHLAVATVIGGASPAQRLIVTAATPFAENPLTQLASQGFAQHRSFTGQAALASGETVTARVEWYRARPALHVFGAGDDAIPLVRMARLLGWFVSVADGRSHLATAGRFSEANEVTVLSQGPLLISGLRPTDAAVLLTHSLDQDQRLLDTLLDQPLSYLGVLGPARRTREILETIASSRGLSVNAANAQADAWMRQLHAPIGLDLGGSTPASIALEILAEVQQLLSGGTARPLQLVRGATAAARV